jgi:hypothetical protein
MTTPVGAEPGWAVLDAVGRRIGQVDAVFADYLLVRTRGLLPVDLYVPVTATSAGEQPGTLLVDAPDRDVAYRRWHRPLKRAPHE